MNLSAKPQQGAALAVSLVILLLLTLLATAALKNSVMSEKMGANMQNSERSFQSAESALREGEAWVTALTSQPTAVSSCSSYPCAQILNTSQYLEDQNHSWWQSNSAGFTSATLTGIATQPRYIIEEDRFVPDSLNIGQGTQTGKQFYRITARGTGGSDQAVTVIQTTVPKRF